MLICLKENCLGDELPHYETQGKVSCMYATLRYATIDKHVEFWHMPICVDTADLQGSALALFVVYSIKLHLTAFKCITNPKFW